MSVFNFDFRALEASFDIFVTTTVTQTAMMLCETQEEKEELLKELKNYIDSPYNLRKINVNICDKALKFSQNRKSSTSLSDSDSSERISEFLDKSEHMGQKTQKK